MADFLLFFLSFAYHFFFGRMVSSGWGDAGSVGAAAGGGGGGGRLGGGRGFGACAHPVLGRFLGAVADGEGGWDICGRRQDHGALR